MRLISRSPFRVIPLVAVAAIVTGGTALATMGSGVTPGPLTTTSFADDVAIKFKFEIPGGMKEVATLDDPSQVVTQEITLAPGGHTGWHSHPGPVIVQVRSGTLTYYPGDDPTCTGHDYSAGEAFMDPGQGHVHIARNESATESMTLVAVYFDVPVGASPRIDVPAPGNCPF